MAEKQEDLSYIPLDEDCRENEPLYNHDGNLSSLGRHSWFPKSKLITTITALLAAVAFAVSIALALQGQANDSNPNNLRFPREVKRIERLREIDPGVVNDTWDCLPNQNGLVYLDPEKEGLGLHGLPSGDGKENLFGVGWMHQMYCLALFRNSLYSLMYDGSVSPWGQFERQNELGEPGLQAHIEDCFDYLRQKVLCAGDMTLEGAAASSDPDPLGGSHHIDGFGTTMTCLEKFELGKWAEDRAPPLVVNYPGYGKYLKPPKVH
ncbi:putative Tat pathway signal sequence [Seiridium cardinale]